MRAGPHLYQECGLPACSGGSGRVGRESPVHRAVSALVLVMSFLKHVMLTYSSSNVSDLQTYRPRPTDLGYMLSAIFKTCSLGLSY